MFFKTMRKSLLLLFTILLFSSCSEYQRVLKGTDAGDKFALAESLYKQGEHKKSKLKKSLKLMEQIVPVYRGKPQAEKLMFMYANTFYTLEDFYLAGYQFERFANSYPKSDSVEIASYRSAISYYELSPRYSLDQQDTYTGLEKLQSFIDTYPDSEYRLETNKKVAELRYKLEIKAIEIAKQYLKTGEALGSYSTAIAAFDNFISDFPGSVFRKEAFFGRFEAEYELANHSTPQKVNDRLLTALEYYDDFAKYYKDSDLMPKANEIKADIESRLTSIEKSS